MNIGKILKCKKHKIFKMEDDKKIKKIDVKCDVKFVYINDNNVEFVKDFRTDKVLNSFKTFVKEGQYGIFACGNGKVIGHAWAKICFKDHCKLNGYLKLCKNEALIHFCNVKDDYRGKNIFPAMIAILSHKLLSNKIANKVIIDTESNNIASLNGINKVGFEFMDERLYLYLYKILIFQISTLKNLNLLKIYKDNHTNL